MTGNTCFRRRARRLPTNGRQDLCPRAMCGSGVTAGPMSWRVTSRSSPSSSASNPRSAGAGLAGSREASLACLDSETTRATDLVGTLHCRFSSLCQSGPFRMSTPVVTDAVTLPVSGRYPSVCCCYSGNCDTATDTSNAMAQSTK